MFHQLIKKWPSGRFILPIVVYFATLILFYCFSIFQQMIQTEYPWSAVITSYIFFILVIAFLVYYLIDMGEKESFSTFRFSIQNVLLFIIVLVYSLWIGRFLAENLPVPVNQVQNLQAREQVASLSQALIFAKMFGIVFIVIYEELIFRGLVMKIYFKNSRYGLDVLLSVLLFSCMHLKFPIHYTDFIIYTCVSWPLPVLYRKTGSIYYPIIFHLLYNIL